MAFFFLIPDFVGNLRLSVIIEKRCIGFRGGWTIVLFQTSSPLENTQRSVSFELCLQVHCKVVIWVHFAVTMRGWTHTAQEVKNPKQLSGWFGRWRFIDASVCLDLRQASLN